MAHHSSSLTISHKIPQRAVAEESCTRLLGSAAIGPIGKEWVFLGGGLGHELGHVAPPRERAPFEEISAAGRYSVRRDGWVRLPHASANDYRRRSERPDHRPSSEGIPVDVPPVGDGDCEESRFDDRLSSSNRILEPQGSWQSIYTSRWILTARPAAPQGRRHFSRT
jgi:hypothetical protein